MNNDSWLKLAKHVNALLAQDDVDGIVITHGTDTIEETSYFLNLVVKSKKPVVIVGAMRPSTAISADGPINLYNAVILAGSDEAVGKGVLVALNDQINAAREVTKTNTSTADTFRTPELGFLGYLQGNKPYFYRQSTRRHTVDSEFDVSGPDVLHLLDRPKRGYGCLRCVERQRDSFGCNGRALGHRDQSISAARFIASDAGFLTLIQCVHRPRRGIGRGRSRPARRVQQISLLADAPTDDPS